MNQALEEQIDAVAAPYEADPTACYDKPLGDIIADIRGQHPELEGAIPAIRERIASAIIADMHKKHPAWELHRIELPDDPDALYLFRTCTWFEYKTTKESAKSDTVSPEKQINQDMVQRFLVYPRPASDWIQDMLPGKLVTLASMITRGMGFGQGATIKKV